jgi:hypothetical protein
MLDANFRCGLLPIVQARLRIVDKSVVMRWQQDHLIPLREGQRLAGLQPTGRHAGQSAKEGRDRNSIEPGDRALRLAAGTAALVYGLPWTGISERSAG